MARMLVIALVAMLLQLTSAQLKWPDAYQVSGNIYLPYGDIAEPYTAYVNMGTGQSRLDTYGGMSTVVSVSNDGQYGTQYKIVPETTQNFTNRITCFKIPGMQGAAVMPQGVLPNISSYKYAADITYQGKPTSVYLYNYAEGTKNNNYTLLVAKENQYPMVLRFVGYDNLFGSHYDEYVVEYNTFSPSAPDPDVFKIQDKFQCISYPGPGITDPQCENPFFELVGAKGYSASDRSKRIENKFDEFKGKHGKQYKDEIEEAQRKTHFRHNYRYIHSINRKNLSYKLAVNHLTDLSTNELRKMRGYRATKDSPRRETYTTSLSMDDVPTYYNWWLRGAVTPVKDQGICGSCWSFGTVGTIEGSYFIKKGRLMSFSEQSLVDCSWGYGNNGCDGGESERAYQWIIKNGCIPTEDSYGQYLMEDGRCHTNMSVCGASLSSFVNTPSGNVTALVAAIYENGPISVAIDASHMSFSFYANGVYYEPQCGNTPDDLDHQVLAVGYGTLNGQDYYIIKNSWSTHWGMDGYVLMSRKDNNCGVATDASYGIIA